MISKEEGGEEDKFLVFKQVSLNGELKATHNKKNENLMYFPDTYSAS